MNAKFETFFVKALYEAKIEEFVNTYREKHFSAKKHVQIDDMEFDVVVEQAKKNIAFEIRVLPLSRTEMNELDKYHEKAKALSYDFRLITIAKPKKSSIAINWLDKALLEYFAAHPENTGTTMTIPAVNCQEMETAIESIEITGSEALVHLDGNLSINFQYPSSAQTENDKHAILDMLSFQGRLSLNLSEHKINQADLKFA